MPRRSMIRGLVGVLAWLLALWVLHYKPWVRADASHRARLTVGFLPVT